MLKRVGNRGIAEIVALFTAVLLAGFFIALWAVRTASVSVLYKSMESPFFIYTAYALDAAMAVIAALLILKRQRRHEGLLFGLLEGIVVAFTSFFMFLLLFAFLPGGYATYAAYFAIASSLMLVALKERYPKLRDTATMASSIGVGIVLGLNFGFGYAIAILAVVAVYDYIAVFNTERMASAARAFSSRNLAFLLSVSDAEPAPGKNNTRAESREYAQFLKGRHKSENPAFKKVLKSGGVPAVSQISLGEGDLSLPLMSVISAYYTLSSIEISAILMAGSVLGIIATMLLLRRYRRPLPAVPPLFAFISIAAGIALFVTRSAGFRLSALLIIIGTAAMLIDMLTLITKKKKQQ